MTIGMYRQNGIDKTAQARTIPAASGLSAASSDFSALLSSANDEVSSVRNPTVLSKEAAALMMQQSKVLISSTWAFDDALTPVSIPDSPLEQPITAVVPNVENGMIESLPAIQDDIAPVAITSVGNSDADDLVSRVLAIRTQNGRASDAQVRSVASVQTYLKALHYDIGSFGPYSNGVDGVLGDYTKSALKQFQQDAGLAVTGEIDTETVAQLREKALPKMASVDNAWASELATSQYDSTAYSGVANPFWYTEFVVGKGDDATTMGNIDPVFKGRLAALARDTGHGFRFGEGYRSFERQAYLYNQYINHGGPIAAKPGESNHNRGLAVDTQSSWLQQLEDHTDVANQYVMQMYGLYKPLANKEGTSHENWHIQPLELWAGTENNG